MATRERPGADSADLLRLPERYRVRRHLASGGMATVWCAEDGVLGRAVAIKILAQRLHHDDMAMRRFKREARAAARVSNHAHVVSIFDIGDLEPEDGLGPARPFIVMEYLAGGTVADALRVGAVRRQEAIRWLREAASALDHAHRQGIVHRDIKPANFLLNRSRVLHVADFGIARLVSEDTITSAGELFGTAAYLSPEQALGREATGASDRYALAVAAFELLTGERPFSATHFAAQARQHVEEPPPRASQRDRTLPPLLDDVLIRGMAKEPDERFETAGAFVDAMETALSGGIPVTARARPAHTGRGVSQPAARTVAALAAPSTAVAAPWNPGDPLTRGSSKGWLGGRALALAALLVAIVGVGAVLLSGLGPTHPAHLSRATADRTARHVSAGGGHTKAASTAARVKTKPPASASSTAAVSTPAPTAVAQQPQTAEQLQLAGHQEMLDGNYQTAIASLRKAVSAASPGSLTYAYALYDLGRTMVLNGDPAGAVPILEKRLQIPNQTAVVQQELNAALQASGQAPQTPAPSGASGAPAPGARSHGHHGRGSHGLHPGASGGAGLGGDEQSNFATGFVD